MNPLSFSTQVHNAAAEQEKSAAVFPPLDSLGDYSIQVRGRLEAIDHEIRTAPPQRDLDAIHAALVEVGALTVRASKKFFGDNPQ